MSNRLTQSPLLLFSPREFRLPAAGQAARWGWYLLLSCALHLALLTHVPFASRTRDTQALPPLEVRLSDPSDLFRRDAIPEPQHLRPRDDSARNATVGAEPAEPRSGARPVPETETVPPASPSEAGNRDIPAAGALLGMARKFAREPGPRQETEPGGRYGTGLSVSERFARILKRPEAGERRLENGMIKITTPGGTVYCITEPPQFMRSGVVPPMAVPTTCP
jgi:hypothetical protein